MHRALVAAAVVLLTGNIAVWAQTSSGSSQNTGSSSGSYDSSSSGSSQSGTMQSQASGSDPTPSTTHSSDKLSWGDRRFVTKAADAGQEEVDMAKLAAEKASSPDVRNFAQQLMDQHQQVNSQLMSIASAKNVKIDQDDTTKDRAYKRLSKASGNDFDREFVDHMVDQHEKDIKLYQKAANDAKDPEVRQFASSTLEHLRQHLTQVQQLQQSIVPTGRMDTESGGRSSTGTSTTTTTTSGRSGSSMSGSMDTSATGSSGTGATTGGTTTSSRTTR